MREVAEDVFHLPLTPRSSVNAYLLGDVLVDAGYFPKAAGLLKAVRGRAVARHVVTHAHLDHAGGSRAVQEALGVPVQGGERDVEALRSGRMVFDAPRLLRPAIARATRVAPVPDAEPLEIGSEVGPGFVVLDTPGHSPGHVSLWRERDGVLVCGDVVNAMSLITTRPGLHEPPAAFTPDVERNRESIRTIAALRPRLVLAGHGPPLRDAAEPLAALAASLPS